MTNDPVQAEDLHQETFVRLLAPRHWAKVKPLHPKQQLTWLLRTAHRVFIDQCRREGRVIWELLPDELPAPVGWPVQIDQRVDAEKMLGRLPVEHRAVLFLRFVADLRPAEIGDVLGMPPRTVTRRLDQAKRMARRLTAAPGEEG